MKIDWTKTLLTRDGKTLFAPAEDGKAQSTTPITLKELVMGALDSWNQRREMPASEKYDRYKVLKAINEGDGTLKTSEVATCIKAVEEYSFLPFVHGQIMDILDTKESDLKLVGKQGEA